MPYESTDGGTDNPAFTHDEDNSSAGRGSESAACNSSGDEKVANENGNHSFVSKHYVEPRKSPEAHFKTETRIEVPDETTDLEKPKQNGHQNGNGNNNDVSFLNTTVTSVSNNDVNDKKEPIEAVNLELVSMKPYSGSNAHQTKNQEACEVPADPYEEYFVPVNEHRKFMRGEKLYVTKDKRSTKSYWRKIVCWGCGFLIVAIIAIIAILAGTGVILMQDDTHPLLNSDKTSSRQFNDVHSAGSQEYIKNPPSSPPPATSTFPPWPTTDESLYRYVPKALDGVLKLDDLDWNNDMNNPKSRVYREVVDDLERNLVKMLSLNDVMPIVKVHSISKDGEVKFRVSQPVFEKLQDNQNHLEDKFRQNGSAIGKYHVNHLQIHSLVNDCYSGNMKCNDSCVYDYLETIFICMCPTGQSFDSNNKKCIDNIESTHTHFTKAESEDIRGRSRIPDDVYHPESHDWKDSNFVSLERQHEHTSSEPTKRPEPSSEPQPVAEPKAEPEPIAEPKTESETFSKVQPVSEPNSESVSSGEPQPAAEPKTEPEPSGEPQSDAEPKSEPEPVSEPHQAVEPQSEPEPTSEPQPAAEPKSEPEPSGEPQSDAEPKSEPEPVSEPQPAVEPEPISESQPAAEPKIEPEPSGEPQSATKSKSEPEPTGEPQPAAESKIEPEPSGEPQSDAEPKSEPEPVSEPQPAAEPKSEPEPTSEPQPAAEPKSEPKPSSEPQLVVESNSKLKPPSELKPSAGSEPEPISEPKPETEPTTLSETAAEPKSEPEPTSESQPAVEPTPSKKPIVEPESEPEPASEPQPAAEPITPIELMAETKSKLEPASDIKNKSEPSGEPQPIAEHTASTEPLTELNSELDLKSVLKNEPESSSEPIPFTNKSVMSSSMPSAVTDPAILLSTGGTFENTSQFSATSKEIGNFSTKLSEINATENHQESHENSAINIFSMSPEDTTIPNEPATVIGLNEATSQMNSENQSEIEKNNESETDVVLGKEFVKKGSHYNTNEQDSSNPVEVHVKEFSVSGKIEQNNDTNNYSSVKNEVSPEERYNEITAITDDFVPKGFGKNDIELSNEEKKIHKIYKDNKNNNYTKSKVDSESADKLSFKSSTTAQTVEVIDKRVEDPNMTSQIPILPIEIQSEMSTTENSDKMYPKTISQETEKEISSTSLPTKIINTEGKTTEQIPILPEELQTTMINRQEHHTEATLAVIETDNKSNGLVAAGYKKEEMNKEENNSEFNRNNSTNLTGIVDKDLIEKTTIYNLPSESPVKDIIKPVFESISDDTTPQNFEYKYLLTTTTEKSDTSNDFEEMTEDQLRVIPLEEKDTYMLSRKSEESTKIKKEKELNFNMPADNENGNNVDRKSSRTVDDDNIPKLISGSSSDVDSNAGLKTIFISNDFNGSKSKVIIPSSEKKINSTATVIYPNFIPVSEEIDESDYHFTESTHSQLYNRHNIATDLPELLSKDVKNNTDQDADQERAVKETATELLQAVESSTNKTLLVENSVTKNEIEGNSSKNVEETTTEDNKLIVSSTSEPSQPEFPGIPVAIVTSEEEIHKQIFFSKCKSGQFQCVNGTSRDGSYCVDLSSTCDSENDCSDGSDEFDCEKEGCPGNFQCASGQCLKRHLVCNGISDCDDGTDERECSNWKCHSDEFQCPKGRCIPVLWQCDGRPDCENHADEYSCSESCGNDEYLCPTEKWCIPQTWRCNDVTECVNGEDEKLCECAVDQVKCETGGCIPAEQFCDGVENCPDRSDEWSCLSGFNRNSSISTEVDKENKENEFSTKSSPIMIRQSNGEQRYICSEGWTDAFSDQYCRSLGFAAAESTQFTEVGTDKKLLQLMTKANPNSSIVLNLSKTDSCNSSKVVEVSCQEFSCRSHESVGPTARLVGGTPTTEGQWSSVALLKEPKYGTSCTASILSPMHALASYSCIYSNRQSGGWQLFVGGNLLKPNKVKNIVPYPQVKYNQFLYDNDIVLVELAEPLVFSRNVSAACLPNQSFQPPQLCVTVGWGFPVNGEIDLQQYLKFLPVPTYNSEECNATSHYAGFITKNNICAGFTDTDKGPCYNDEGAPLMCVSEIGRWEIQGLLSHHSRCSRGHPSIYSSLAPALSWLRNLVPALQAHY